MELSSCVRREEEEDQDKWNANNQTGYPKERVVDAVYLSGAAYCDIAEIRTWTCAVCSQRMSHRLSNVTVVSDDVTKTVGYIYIYMYIYIFDMTLGPSKP